MIAETEKYKNHTIEIHYDEDPDSPREWDNLGTMVCWHKRYKLGDVQPKESPEEYLRDLGKDIFLHDLYLYDHSGITMNTTGFSCPWDSGQVGFIYVTKEKVREEFNVKKINEKLKKRVYDLLKYEVETYDSYIRGNVYGYIVKDSSGEDIDSCWGYYSIKDAIKVAKDIIDYQYISCIPYKEPMTQTVFEF